MKLPNWLIHTEPGPSVIGRFDLTAYEVDDEQLQAHEEKLRRAKEHIAERGLRIPAAYGKLQERKA